MSYIRKRVPRKPGPSPQDIIADQQTLVGWMKENVNLIVYTTGTMLFILIIVLGVMWMKNDKRQSANAALSGAMAMYQKTVAQLPEGTEAEAEGLEMALETLEEVLSEYPRTPQGGAASLFKANVLYRLGRYREAADTIENLEKTNRDLLNSINGYYLLGRSYEAMEEFGPAIRNYERAKENTSGDMRAVIDIDLARCYQLSGDLDTAISLFRDILDRYPDTIFATRAGKKLATLGILDQESL